MNDHIGDISAKDCLELVQAPRVVVPGKAGLLGTSHDGEPLAINEPADFALGGSFRKYEEVVVEKWYSTRRIAVLPVARDGLYDGVEIISVRDRIRLSSFRSMALVGLTTAVPAPTGLARAAMRLGSWLGGGVSPSASCVELGLCSWYGLVDRLNGRMHDYDSAAHFIGKIAKLDGLDGIMRGGFLYMPRADHAATTTPEAWIRRLFELRPDASELSIRPIDCAPDASGRTRHFIARRNDWEDT